MTEERRIRKNIRNRDRRNYVKLHGPIPCGYTIHHLFYDETGYNEESFVVITKEEHEAIHGCTIQGGEGFDMSKYRIDNKERISDKAREYYVNHSEELKKHSREYRKSHKEYYREYGKEYYEAHKEENREKKKEYMKAYNARKRLEKERGDK